MKKFLLLFVISIMTTISVLAAATGNNNYTVTITVDGQNLSSSNWDTDTDTYGYTVLKTYGTSTNNPGVATQDNEENLVLSYYRATGSTKYYVKWGNTNTTPSNSYTPGTCVITDYIEANIVTGKDVNITYTNPTSNGGTGTITIAYTTPAETVIPEAGKVYTLKGRINSDGTITEYYLTSSRQQGALSLAAVNVNKATIGPEYYWIISEGPNYNKSTDTSAPGQTSYYYISSFIGDGYIGYGPGYDYTHKVETDKGGVVCTDEYAKEFEFLGFHTTDQIKTYGTKETPSDGAVALYFYNKQVADGYRYIAINSATGELNWYQRISRGDTNNAAGGYWSTDFIFEEVEVDPSTGSSNLGFSITFTRSSDDAYEKNPNNGTPDFNYYATCKLPFAVILPNNVKAFTAFSATEKHTDITLKELALPDHVLPRETPVLLMMPGEQNDGAANDQKTIIANPITAQNIYFETEYTKNCFEGTLGAKTLETNEGIYILGKKNGLVALYKASSANMKNNRAYLNGLKLTNGNVSEANNITFHFEGDEDHTTTGINEINTVNTNNAMYDLQGRRVVNTVKGGMYIQNGKKMIVK